MKTQAFEISIADIEALQKTVKRLEAKPWSDYKPYEYLLTDTDQPLDLLCIAFWHRTQNEAEEQCREDRNQAESFSCSELNYSKAFISTLTKQQRIALADNIPEYDKQLEEFETKEKENFERDCEFDHKDLQNEHQKNMDRYYKHFTHEYLYGDRSNDGVIQLLKRDLGDDIDLHYTSETWNITINQHQEDKDEEFDYENKQDFLETMKYKARTRIMEKDAQRKKRNEDYALKSERKKEHKIREDNNKRKLLLEE